MHCNVENYSVCFGNDTITHLTCNSTASESLIIAERFNSRDKKNTCAHASWRRTCQNIPAIVLENDAINPIGKVEVEKRIYFNPLPEWSFHQRSARKSGEASKKLKEWVRLKLVPCLWSDRGRSGTYWRYTIIFPPLLSRKLLWNKSIGKRLNYLILVTFLFRVSFLIPWKPVIL